MDHQTTLNACQSILQLSVGLNGAYFTFRAANEPGFEKLEAESLAATTLRNEHDLLKTNVSAQRSYLNMIASFNKFIRRSKNFYHFTDKYMLWIGYIIALVSVVLLVISSLRPDQHISYQNAIIIFLILYVPVSLCILAEFAISVARLSQSKSIKDFIELCQGLIRGAIMPKEEKKCARKKQNA
jgi:hypothetical protein